MEANDDVNDDVNNNKWIQRLTVGQPKRREDKKIETGSKGSGAMQTIPTGPSKEPFVGPRDDAKFFGKIRKLIRSKIARGNSS